MIQKYATGAKRAVEIGVFEGVNSVNILKVMSPEGTFYGIDPFFKGSLGICYSKLITKNWIKTQRLKPKVNFLEKLSFDAVNDVPNEIDFIFVDGDHSLEGMQRDWLDWAPKVAKGGFVALHDTAVPSFRPTANQLGSYIYFNKKIKNDPGFKVVATIDSLNILEKL